MKCSIVRTHERGRALRDGAWRDPVEGAIRMFSYRHEVLRRDVSVLSVARQARGGAALPPLIPDLHEPQLVTFGTSPFFAMMVAGWEEIAGQRYYQGWYIRFGE